MPTKEFFVKISMVLLYLSLMGIFHSFSFHVNKVRLKMLEDRYIRLNELAPMLGLGKSTIYRLIQENKFPKQIKLTERTVVWRLSTIHQWVEDREKASGI